MDTLSTAPPATPERVPRVTSILATNFCGAVLSDQQLLEDYAERRSRTPFEELVRRHIDLVYSAALRIVRRPDDAEDVTQCAFATLAQKAREVAEHPVLSGWLHLTTRNLAAKEVRSDVRRRARE